MPKLPTLTTSRVVRLLEKKGFLLERSSGSHRIYMHPETHKIAVVPFHKKDLPKGTLLEILRQAGLRKEEISKTAARS
jgi:predicted RNA binding protein YcfA (HicA-like mRNA interferase family)